MSDRLSVALIWHLHQPLYRELASWRCHLPWVRLHGVRAYHDMPDLLGAYPTLKATFNLVPVLLSQLELYVEHGASDDYLEHARIPADALDPDQRVFLLTHFFKCQHERMLKPLPAYARLLERRGPDLDPQSLRAAAQRFTTAELRDLQVLFNLVWFGPRALRCLPELVELRRKGAGFSEADKQRVLDLQREVLGRVIPLYRRCTERGQAELSSSPFYHPILPLLIDSDCAARARPDAPRPPRFAYPSDAGTQIRRALESHRRRFGRPARGLWPSEGSVSPAAAELCAAAGVDWIASDEGVLQRSLEGYQRDRDLYRPWRFETPSGAVHLFFRDHELSDRIGFVYAGHPPAEAAADLIARLEHKADTLAPGSLVTVILDGENPWEHYLDGGEPFLQALYQRFERSRKLRTVTPAEFLAQQPRIDPLPTLHTGSWIDADFAVWIGSRYENRAWELLGRARRWLEQQAEGLPSEKRAAAFEALYAAEGSDWFWWFGERFSSSDDGEYDRLFRQHLGQVYRAAGAPVPEDLRRPVQEPSAVRPAPTVGPMSPAETTTESMQPE